MKIMKTLGFCVFISLFLFILTFSVQGVASKMTAQDLYGTWVEEGRPDYIGGVYLNDDNTKRIILLVNMNDEIVEKMKSQISDINAVEFVSCKYSFNQLQKVMDNISFVMHTPGNEGIYSLSIDETNNRVEVGVKPNLLENYTKMFKDLYGDKVFVEVGEINTDDSTPSVQVGEKVVDDTKLYKNNYTKYILIGIGVFAVLLVIIITLFIFKRKNSKVIF